MIVEVEAEIEIEKSGDYLIDSFNVLSRTIYPLPCPA